MYEDLRQYTRFNVVGSSGSGKSTTGRAIADALNLPYVEIDKLFWKPNWTESTDGELETSIKDAISGDGWVLDGNYSRTTPLKWEHAQVVVWLDLPYLVILYQVIVRTLVRSFSREVLWAGNRESLRKAFFASDSIILWSASNLTRVRRGYDAAMKDPTFGHLLFVRLRSRRQVAGFISRLRS
jgi:adenylate kinase family enzyme